MSWRDLAGAVVLAGGLAGLLAFTTWRSADCTADFQAAITRLRAVQGRVERAATEPGPERCAADRAFVAALEQARPAAVSCGRGFENDWTGGTIEAQLRGASERAAAHCG